MSGRDQEPIAAFFPSIDRNLIRDLDRHLRSAAPPSPNPPPAPEAKPVNVRHGTSDILQAVQQAAASMAAMQARIQELEARHYELESTNTQLKAKLGELLQSQQVAESTARADRERAVRAEQIAEQHQARVAFLERDLATAHGDLKQISEVITGALGGPLRSAE